MAPFDSTKHLTGDEAREIYGDDFVDKAILAGIRVLRRGTAAKPKDDYNAQG